MARSSRSEIQHIGQAIQELLKTQHLKPKFDETNVVASWERLVGRPIAKRTNMAGNAVRIRSAFTMNHQ